jgi:hypothetical protein
MILQRALKIEGEAIRAGVDFGPRLLLRFGASQRHAISVHGLRYTELEIAQTQFTAAGQRLSSITLIGRT